MRREASDEEANRRANLPEPDASRLSGAACKKLATGLGLGLALLFVFSSGFVLHLDTFNDQNGIPEEVPALVTLGRAMFDYFVTGERDGDEYMMHVDANVH